MIGRGGRLIDKSEWPSAANIEAFVDRYQQGRRRKPATGTIAPYITEQLKLRDVDREAFYERLRRNGERAYDEFKRGRDLAPTNLVGRPRTCSHPQNLCSVHCSPCDRNVPP